MTCASHCSRWGGHLPPSQGRHQIAHSLLTLQGNFPTAIIVTPGSVHDVNILDQLAWEIGSFYITDRGYLDFARLHRLHQSAAIFVTRA